jgi:hypothetical protein
MKLNESNKSKVLSMVKTAVFFALVFTLVITSAGSVNATSPKPSIVLVHGGWDNSRVGMPLSRSFRSAASTSSLRRTRSAN